MHTVSTKPYRARAMEIAYEYLGNAYCVPVSWCVYVFWYLWHRGIARLVSEGHSKAG